jgi:Zn-dependent metallo-hydrolase RNA specificity domain
VAPFDRLDLITANRRQLCILRVLLATPSTKVILELSINIRRWTGLIVVGIAAGPSALGDTRSLWNWIPVVILLTLTVPFSLISDDVLQHHLNGTRNGLYVDPLITQKTATTIHRDKTFNASLPGPVYAQPLYARNGPGGMGLRTRLEESGCAFDLVHASGHIYYQDIMEFIEHANPRKLMPIHTTGRSKLQKRFTNMLAVEDGQVSEV